MRRLWMVSGLALLAAAACSRSDTATPAAPAETPAASSAAPSAPAGPTFAGTWTSGYGPMTLAQTAAGEVTGTYGSSGGRVLGTAAGDRFTGHWIGPGTRCAPGSTAPTPGATSS